MIPEYRLSVCNYLFLGYRLTSSHVLNYEEHLKRIIDETNHFFETISLFRFFEQHYHAVLMISYFTTLF